MAEVYSRIYSSDIKCSAN